MIEKEIVHTVETFYFGSGWRAFFDPRVEGGFFQLVVFIFRVGLILFLGWVTLFMVADVFGEEAIKKYASMSDTCKVELTNAFKQYGSEN